MFLKKIRSFIVLVFLLLLLFTAVIILANTLIQTPYIQNEILKKVSQTIGYDIQAKEIEISLSQGLGLSINDLEASSRNGREKFSALNIKMMLKFKELMAGRIIPYSIHLSKPKIELPWQEGYEDITGFLPKTIPVFWFPEIDSLVIDQGYVIFTGASFKLDKLYLSARRISPSPLTLMVISRGQAGFKGKKVGFEMNGKIVPPSANNDSTTIDIKVKTDQAPLGWIPWPASIPLKDGSFETGLQIKGDPSAHLTIKGQVNIKGLEFELLHKDKHKGFLIPEITLDFQSVIDGDSIDVRPLKINNADLSLDAGIFFNRKKEGRPFLNLNVKSDFMMVETFKKIFPSPLLPLWFEDRLFPLFADGDIRINNFTLKGGIDQIRNMSSPENRSVMEMSFECRGFEVSGGNIQLPFKNVSAEVALKDGLFRVSGLKGTFGDSIIKDAGLNIMDIFSDSRFFEILIDGDFDIKKLLNQKEMEVVPVKVSRQIDQWPDLSGRLTCKTRIGYQTGWACPRILNGEFLLNDFNLDKKDFHFPLILNKASIHIDDSGSDYIIGTGSWGNSSFDISANFNLTDVTFDFKDCILSAYVDMNEVIPIIHPDNKIPLTFPEPLSCNLSLAKDNKDWALKGHVNLGDISIGSETFLVKSSGKYQDNITFDLGIKPSDNKIDLKNVILKLKDSSINMTGIYDLKTNKFIDINLDSSGLYLKDLSILANKSEVLSEGILKGNVKILFPDKIENKALLSGRIEGTDLAFQPGKPYPPISDISFQFDFSDKNVTINSCNFKTGKSLFSITGGIKGWHDLQGQILVHSDYLDFSDILPIEAISISSDSRDNRYNLIDHLDLSIQMDIAKGIWWNLPYGQLNAHLEVKNGNLFIKDSKVNLENGELSIKGNISKLPTPELSFTGDINIKEQPVDELLKNLGINYDGLKGNLALKGTLSISGKEKKDLISSLNGSIKVSIKKGLIKKPSVIIKVLNFLSLQKIFEKRPAAMKEEGMYFESISGNAVIEKGVLKTEDFVMRSPVLNAVAYGKADIPGKKVDFILGAQPHGTIDSLVSKVPILGYIITGKNKSIVAYPFEVKGAFSNPDVTFVPFDTIEGGVLGILKRLFLTPVRIFDKIGNALNHDGKQTAPNPENGSNSNK